MKRIKSWQILACTAIIVLVGVNEDWFIYPHQCRFHCFMNENKVEYTDSGCEYGWQMTSLFKPWSGPDGKSKLQREWNASDSVYVGMTQSEYNQVAPFNED